MNVLGWISWLVAYATALVSVVFLGVAYHRKRNPATLATLVMLVPVSVLIIVRTLVPLISLTDSGPALIYTVRVLNAMTVAVLIFAFPYFSHSLATHPSSRWANAPFAIAAVTGMVAHIVLLLLGNVGASDRVLLFGIAISILYSMGRRVVDAVAARRSGVTESPLHQTATAMAFLGIVLFPAIVIFDLFYAYLPWIDSFAFPAMSVTPLFFTIFTALLVRHAISELGTDGTKEGTNNAEPPYPVRTPGDFEEHSAVFSDRAGLTEREREVLALLVSGKRYVDIAELLFISLPTVKTHVRNIYQKTKTATRAELIHTIRTYDPS